MFEYDDLRVRSVCSSPQGSSVLTAELRIQWRMLWSEGSLMSNEGAHKKKGDTVQLKDFSTPTWLYLSSLILCYWTTARHRAFGCYRLHPEQILQLAVRYMHMLHSYSSTYDKWNILEQ
jgi:hypothetical protein